MAATRQICIPVIQPSSASYCPPLLVTCIADLQQFEELWVVVTTPKHRISQLYTSPFMIDDIGRVQLSAFVRRPGICDGPSSSAIFELSLSAPPLGKAFTASLIRASNEPSVYSQTGLNVSGPIALNASMPAMMNATLTSASLRNPAGPKILATPTCQFTCVRIGGGPVPEPHLFQSLHPQDIAISVCDASGAPIALMDAPTSAVVVLDVPEHSAVLTCKANVEVVGTEAVKTLPQFQSLNDLLVTREGTSSAQDNNNRLLQAIAGGNQSTNNANASRDVIMSLGKTSSRTDTNGALGITAPEIGVLSTANGCGIMFRVQCVMKGAIGLDEPQNAEDLRRGVRNDIAHSFHFTGDVGITNAVDGLYKIFDRTEPTRTIETRTFRVGDTFSLTMRPSGDVDYIHNDRIVFTSRAKNGIEALLSAVVRIYAEGSSPSIADMSLVPPRADQRFVIPSLIYNGPSGEGMLRVWLSGREFAPATAKVRLTSSSLPKWAFSTFSVASMFAVGAFGCDGAKVAEAMVTTESETLQLFQVDPDAVTGQQYGRQRSDTERNDSSQLTSTTSAGMNKSSQISSSVGYNQRTNEVVTRGPAGSGDDGSSWNNRNASSATGNAMRPQRQKMVNPQYSQNQHPYGHQGLGMASGFSPSALGEGRSGSLASLASNKRRALDAVFD